MPAAQEHILAIEGLGVSYGDAEAVRGFSLALAPGEIVGLVGESGSGKSSVLRAVAGLLGRGGSVAGGRILYGGRDLASLGAKEHVALRGEDIAYVFQDPTLSLDPLFKIGRQFDECLRVHGIAKGREMRKLEEDLLREMGFEDPARILESYPHALSGGMCQRAVLAFSVACGPSLLLADEPTSALDVESQLQVLNLLRRIRDERGVSMLVVSHNIAAVAFISDRIGVMRGGELVEIGPREQVLHDPQHPYTGELIASIPKMNAR